MTRHLNGRSYLIVGAAALALVSAGAFAAMRSSTHTSPSYRGTPAASDLRLPRFSLLNYQGRRVSSTDLQGRVVVMTFLDSKCTDACPIVASVVARAVDQLGRDRPNVVTLALSMNPRADTPTRIRDFLATRHATGRIDYLVG